MLYSILLNGFRCEIKSRFCQKERAQRTQNVQITKYDVLNECSARVYPAPSFSSLLFVGLKYHLPSVVFVFLFVQNNHLSN